MKIFIHNIPIASFDKIISNSYKKSLKIIKKYRPEILKELSKIKGTHLNLFFITDADIQELNKEFRKKDSPTDVLSWGYINSDLQPNEAFGEIYISVDTAKFKSQQKNISLEEEFLFLFVHGLLHVFNYDHNNDNEENEMNLVTTEILQELNVDSNNHL